MNPKLATGEIEVTATELTIFNKSETPPFEIEDKIDTARGEAARVPLPRPAPRAAAAERCMTRSQDEPRSRAATSTEQGFLELETPFMVQVHARRRAQLPRPVSRLNPGKFYALAESPQLFKQLFMVRGLRPLLPDREVLPRRGPAPRPPARVHADRRRDELRQPGRRLHASSRGCIFKLSGRRCSASTSRSVPERPLPAHGLRRVDGEVRQRQAGPALRPRARRCSPSSSSSTTAAACRSRADRREVRGGAVPPGSAEEIVKAMVIPAEQPTSRAPRATSSRSS